MEEWYNLNQGRPYNNVYLLQIGSSTLKVLDSKSIIPPNILEGIRSTDIIASTVSNPFKLAKIDEDFFLFNSASERVFKLLIKNDKIGEQYAIDLSNKFFLEHPKISQDEFNQNQSKRSEWINNGHFLLNIFKDNDDIIFYLSDITVAGSAVYLVIICDIKTLEVQNKYIFKNFKPIRNIDENKIITFSFDYEIDKYVYKEHLLNDLSENK